MAMRGLTDEVLVVPGRGGCPRGLSFPHDSPVVRLLALKGPVCTEVFVAVPLHALPKVGGPCPSLCLAAFQQLLPLKRLQTLKTFNG